MRKNTRCHVTVQCPTCQTVKQGIIHTNLAFYDERADYPLIRFRCAHCHEVSVTGACTLEELSH